MFAHKTVLKLNSLNLSKLNFFHSNKITEKLDFLSEFKEMMLSDDFHFNSNLENIFYSSNSSNLLAEISENFISIWKTVGFYVKLIFFLALVGLSIIICVKLKFHKDIFNCTFCLFRTSKRCGTFSIKVVRDFLNRNKTKSPILDIKTSNRNINTELLDLNLLNVSNIDTNRISISSL